MSATGGISVQPELVTLVTSTGAPQAGHAVSAPSDVVRQYGQLYEDTIQLLPNSEYIDW